MGVAAKNRATDGAPFVIRNAKVYVSPDAPPVERGSVLVRDGRIAAVGTEIPIPPEAQVLPGEGCVLTAGFWNAHVHFTEPKWRDAGRKVPQLLDPQLQEMFTSRGFTSVVDTGSDPRSTLPLRDRIRTGELRGPRIYTAGTGLYPPKGIPYYVRDTIPFWIRPFIPQPSTPAAAARMTKRNIARGTDLLKLFTGSYVMRGQVTTMPESIARAAIGVAHAHGRLVYSHPSNLEGTRIALRTGVDVLAHPPDTTDGVDASLIREIVDRGMGMTPTLKMFADTASSDPSYLNPIYEVVRQFHRLGGQLLFGTDVGYMADYSIENELQALTRAGVDARGVLKMMTMAPAQRFGVGNDTGSISVGKQADLVLLRGDPIEDLLALTRVEMTIRSGQILYRRT